MTTPELQVQVGLAGTDTPTSTAAVTWTTVTNDLELGDSGGPVEIGWGRADEIAQADPNTCTLILAASEFKQDADGPYVVPADSGTAASIVIGQALRVRGKAHGYSMRQRFFGYVSSITPLWPDGDAEHLRVEIRAESRLAWIARAKQLQDRSSAAMLAAGATSYWPMTEKIPNHNSLSDPSPPWFEFDEQPHMYAIGLNPKGLTGGFGVAPIETLGLSPDGLGVANISIGPTPLDPTAGDKFEARQGAAQAAPIPTLGATQAFTVTMIGRSARGPLTDQRTFEIFTLTGRDDLGLHNAFASDGALRMVWNTSTLGSGLWTLSVIDGSTLVNTGFGVDYIGDNAPFDRRWHLYTMTSSGGSTPTIKAYRDRTLVVTMGPLAAGDMSDFNSVIAGNMTYLPDGTDTDADGYADSAFVLADDPRHEFGRLAIMDGVELSAGDISDLYDAVIAGTIGDDDTVEARLERWFDYAGYPANRLTVTDPGATPLTAQDVNGASPLQLMQEVANTDGGVLFDDLAGTDTTYYGRSVRLTGTTDVTLDVAAQEVQSGLTAPVDLANLVNSVTAVAADGSAKVTRTDGASIALRGYSGEEQTLHTNSAAHLLARADWRLHTSSVPRSRAPELSLELSGLSDIQQDAVLGIGMWSVVDLSGLPSAAAGVPSSCFVEGGTELWTFQSCAMTLNVTDAAPEFEVGIYDDPARGLFDTAVFG